MGIINGLRRKIMYSLISLALLSGCSTQYVQKAVQRVALAGQNQVVRVGQRMREEAEKKPEIIDLAAYVEKNASDKLSSSSIQLLGLYYGNNIPGEMTGPMGISAFSRDDPFFEIHVRDLYRHTFGNPFEDAYKDYYDEHIKDEFLSFLEQNIPLYGSIVSHFENESRKRKQSGDKDSKDNPYITIGDSHLSASPSNGGTATFELEDILLFGWKLEQTKIRGGKNMVELGLEHSIWDWYNGISYTRRDYHKSSDEWEIAVSRPFWDNQAHLTVCFSHVNDFIGSDKDIWLINVNYIGPTETMAPIVDAVKCTLDHYFHGSIKLINYINPVNLLLPAK